MLHVFVFVFLFSGQEVGRNEGSCCSLDKKHVVHTEATRSRDLYRGYVAGTNSQHVHTWKCCGLISQRYIYVAATIMDKFIGTIQRYMFQLTLSHTFWVLLQPAPPHSMLLGRNKLKTACRTESGPVYAQH